MFYEINNVNFKTKVEGESLKIKDMDRDLGIHRLDGVFLIEGNKTCDGWFVIIDIKTGAKVCDGNTKRGATTKAKQLKDELNNMSIERENELITKFNKLVDYETYKNYSNVRKAHSFRCGMDSTKYIINSV